MALNGRWAMIDIRHGDCITAMQAMDDACVDAIVTDPPAGISFMGKAWDGDKGGRDQWVAWMQSVAVEAMRVAKPGAHALVWALPRTSHWTATAWESAGWEVRDRVAHLFGTGFPKSHNLKDEWQGWGTALKPACEDWWLLRKPLSEKTVAANVLTYGTGALNIDASRVGGDAPTSFPKRRTPNAHYVLAAGFHKTDEETAEAHPAGRFPANVIHDGSDEVLEAFAAFGSSKSSAGGGIRKTALGRMNDDAWQPKPGVMPGYADEGSPARFFYSSKASAKDRADSKHPTVKPISRMRYLCKLVTPPGGTVLDMFAGSGTTLQAAMEEGFHAIGIEQSAEYVTDIRNRISAAREGLGLFAVAAE